MFKRGKVRCIDCGFLAAGENADVENPLTIPRRERVRDATWEWNFVCVRGVADLNEETEPIGEPDGSGRQWQVGTARTWIDVLESQRRCAYFERHRPSLSIAGHLELQHRREEWRRTALVALGAAIIGGLIATLPTIIFGHDVTVIIGR